MLLRVQYRNEKYDYVVPETLDELIMTREITRFYRPSENDWVDVDRSPLRGMAIVMPYIGPERRSGQETD